MAQKILVVEDDAFIADIYSSKLKELGFEVEVEGQGDRALKKILAQPPDLVLLDIVLPGLSGWEILKQLEKDGFLKKIKVLVLSNLEQRLEVERASAKYGIPYLIKANYTPTEVAGEAQKILQE